jgi:hypothetical protein
MRYMNAHEKVRERHTGTAEPVIPVSVLVESTYSDRAVFPGAGRPTGT